MFRTNYLSIYRTGTRLFSWILNVCSFTNYCNYVVLLWTILRKCKVKTCTLISGGLAVGVREFVSIDPNSNHLTNSRSRSSLSQMVRRMWFTSLVWFPNYCTRMKIYISNISMGKVFQSLFQNSKPSTYFDFTPRERCGLVGWTREHNVIGPSLTSLPTIYWSNSINMIRILWSNVLKTGPVINSDKLLGHG